MSELIAKCECDVMQLLPMSEGISKFSWELYQTGKANNWSPQESPMNRDIQQWKDGTLSEDEKLLVKRVLGFFAGSESLVANNLLSNIRQYINNPHCQQYIGRQTYEELLHNETVVYCCSSLNLDVKEVYEAYKNIPTIKAKDDFMMSSISNLNRPDFDINTIEGKREFIKNLFVFYIVCESLMFYCGFATLLSLHRQNKMTGIGKQIQWTLKDESCHVKFGTYLLNECRQRYPEVFSKEFDDSLYSLIDKAVAFEIEYTKDILPNGIFGLNQKMFMEYIQYIANRRLANLGMEQKFPNSKNPFTWMTEVIDLEKQENFFETKVVDYAVNCIEDDF